MSGEVLGYYSRRYIVEVGYKYHVACLAVAVKRRLGGKGKNNE